MVCGTCYDGNRLIVGANDVCRYNNKLSNGSVNFKWKMYTEAAGGCWDSMP